MSEASLTPPSPLGEARSVAAASRNLAAGRIGLLILAAVTTVVLAAIFVRMMNYDLRKDELLYTAPIALLDSLDLYSDFFYNHVPGSAYLFGAVDKLVGSDAVLFTGRIAVFAGWCVLAGAVVFLSWTLSRSVVFTTFATAMLLSNDLLLSVPGMAATNNFLILPFAVIGLGLFALGAMGAAPRPLPVFFAGASLAAAATVKASAGAFIVPVVVAALLFPRGCSLPQRLRRVVLPLALGGLLASSLVFWHAWQDLDGFLAHVLGFHTGPHVAYWAHNAASEPGLAMAPAEKLRLAYDVWFTGTNLAIVLAIVALVVLNLRGGPHRKNGAATAPVVFFALTAAFVTATTFLPTPAFPQYMALPLAVMPFLALSLYVALPPGRRGEAHSVLLAAAIVALLANAPRFAEPLATAASPDRWTVTRIHEDGVAIREALAREAADGPLATLFPIYAYEGGLEVVPALATGEFGYRIVPYATPTLLRHYRTSGPASIAADLAQDPPAGFLLGYLPDLEAPLLAFARTNGYAPVEGLRIQNRYGDGEVWVRGAGRAGASR